MRQLYIIETKIDGNWTSDGIGVNNPRTHAECAADIEAFEAGLCGPDFWNGEYRIVPVT